MTKRELFRSRCRQWLTTGAMLMGGLMAVCSRNDASYLARPISLRNGEVDSELYNKLMNKDNWYLKK